MPGEPGKGQGASGSTGGAVEGADGAGTGIDRPAPAVAYFAKCATHGLHGERDECFVCGEAVTRVVYVRADLHLRVDSVRGQHRREILRLRVENERLRATFAALSRATAITHWIVEDVGVDGAIHAEDCPACELGRRIDAASAGASDEEAAAMTEDTWQAFRDEIADALTEAYCGGASGRGWTIWGDPIPKEEVKARLVQDPDKTRHIAHMESAVWAVIERWCEAADPTVSGSPGHVEPPTAGPVSEVARDAS